MTGSAATGFQGKPFSTRVGSHGPLLEIALSIWPADAAISILDVGCGDGDMLFQLALHYRNAVLVGADLSTANIAKAQERAAALGLVDRCSFRCVDYMVMGIEPVDLVVSHSTLHLIDADPAELHAKLAHDLKNGGVLMASVPYACLFNTLLMAVRRLARMLRGEVTDHLIERAGLCLAGGRMPVEMIRERVVYMYIIPGFLASAAFDRRLQRLGLELERVFPYPHVSIAQLKHRIGLYRRR
jgi:SAM-dependent methyltransferase